MSRGRYNFEDGFAAKATKITGVALDNGSDTVMQVVTGPVLITSFVMDITEAVSANACTLGVQTNTLETIIATDGVDIVSAAIGDKFFVEGDGTTMVKNAVAGNAANACTIPIMVPVDIINFVLSNSNPTSGIADIYVTYIPMVAGATITTV